jgi:hypothetical protein
MAIKDPTILNRAETQIFEYFTNEVGDASQYTAFIGELPPQAYNCWMFEINGGGEPLDALFVSDVPGNCGRWRMSAMVMGRFTERSDAQYLAGVVRTLVPAVDGFLANIKWLRPVGEPTFERVTVDDGHGNDVPCWEMQYPLEVIMKDDGVANGD